MLLTVKRLNAFAQIPQKGSLEASCWDLRAGEDVVIPARGVAKISTGLSFEIPAGWEVVVRSRSGLASQGIIVANSPATIDSDYTGEVFVLLLNITSMPYTVEIRDKIAQMTVAPTRSIEFVEGDITKITSRGSNGFGSTGRH